MGRKITQDRMMVALDGKTRDRALHLFDVTEATSVTEVTRRAIAVYAASLRLRGRRLLRRVRASRIDNAGTYAGTGEE